MLKKYYNIFNKKKLIIFLLFIDAFFHSILAILLTMKILISICELNKKRYLIFF